MTLFDNIVEKKNDNLILFDSARFIMLVDKLGHRGRGFGIAGPDGALFDYISRLVSTDVGKEAVQSAMARGKKPGIWTQKPENSGNKIEVVPGYWIWKPGGLGPTLKYFYEFYNAMSELEISLETE